MEPIVGKKNKWNSVVRLANFSLVGKKSVDCCEKSKKKHVLNVWSNNEFGEQLMRSKLVGL
jgi:hypothetical protein